MNKKLTFLLALTFLFLFSGNSFGIDFGKSEEEKFKGTNIGIHICSKINMDIVDRGFQEIHKNHKIIEKDLIRKRCIKKHEKIAEQNDWLKGGARFEKTMHIPTFGYRSFKIDIENKSTDKILTSVTVVLTYKDDSREGDSDGHGSR